MVRIGGEDGAAQDAQAALEAAKPCIASQRFARRERQPAVGAQLVLDGDEVGVDVRTHNPR
jgi:hypothetical protein